MELPHANTVSANRLGGNPVNNPNIYSKSIRTCAVAQIQKILIANENTNSNIIPRYGGLFLYVRSLMNIDKNTQTPNAIY